MRAERDLTMEPGLRNFEFRSAFKRPVKPTLEYHGEWKNERAIWNKEREDKGSILHLFTSRKVEYGEWEDCHILKSFVSVCSNEVASHKGSAWTSCNEPCHLVQVIIDGSIECD